MEERGGVGVLLWEFWYWGLNCMGFSVGLHQTEDPRWMGGRTVLYVNRCEAFCSSLEAKIVLV